MNYAASFARMRQMAGNPVLTCVKDRALWTSIPTGYTFDADYDAFVTSGGVVWKPTNTDDLSTSDYVTVAFLPGAGSAEMALGADS